MDYSISKMRLASSNRTNRSGHNKALNLLIKASGPQMVSGAEVLGTMITVMPSLNFRPYT